MRRGGKWSILIPTASANSPPSLSPSSLSASMPALSFPKTAEAGGGEVGGGAEAVPEGGDRRVSDAPSPAGDTPVRDSIDGGDSNANEDNHGAVVGSIGGDGGEEEYFKVGKGRTTTATAAAELERWGVVIRGLSASGAPKPPNLSALLSAYTY